MKIKNYIQSPSIKASDKIICSDGVTGETKNILVSEIVPLGSSAGVESFYNAIATQTSTNAPVMTPLSVNPMGVLVWSYIGAGEYQAVKAGAFTGTPVLIYGANGNADRFVEASLLKIDNNTVKLSLTLSSVSAGSLIRTLTNNLLTNTWIKIINVI